MDGGAGALPERIATAWATRAFSCASGESAGFTGFAAGDTGVGAAASAVAELGAGAVDGLRPHALSSKAAATTKPAAMVQLTLPDWNVQPSHTSVAMADLADWVSLVLEGLPNDTRFFTSKMLIGLLTRNLGNHTIALSSVPPFNHTRNRQRLSSTETCLCIRQ